MEQEHQFDENPQSMHASVVFSQILAVEGPSESTAEENLERPTKISTSLAQKDGRVIPPRHPLVEVDDHR